MNSYNYLLACLKDSNEDTILSLNGYHVELKGYSSNLDSITIFLDDNQEVTITRDSKVFSEYEEEYNILTIEL